MREELKSSSLSAIKVEVAVLSETSAVSILPMWYKPERTKVKRESCPYA
jgi:hypothetical protein